MYPNHIIHFDTLPAFKTLSNTKKHISYFEYFFEIK